MSMEIARELDLDLDEFMRVFAADAEDSLAAMEEGLLQLEANPEDNESLRLVFRAAHTIKGNATMIGLTVLADFAHALETLLQRLRDGECRAEPHVITLLLGTVDALRQAVQSVASGETVDIQATASRGQQQAATLRIDVARLGELLDLTGEISIARGRVRALLERGYLHEAADSHREADGLHAQLREHVMQLRLVPIGPLFRRLRRMVRDLMHTQNKSVQFICEGDDVHLDTSILEQLNDPLVHLVRNALDHGLEPAAERATLGKPAAGSIQLCARHEPGVVVIEVRDDGRGLDRTRIAARAVERGLITSAEHLSDPDVHALIFEPGFSTKSEITELSGRGVGLDIVKRNVDALRGSISIDSKAGSGTTFTLRLPLTVATIAGFSVEAGGETYVLPLDFVVECVEAPAAAVGQPGSGIMNLRGAPVPFVRLAEVFEHATWDSSRETTVVLQHSGNRLAVIVDALHGEGEVVIKPLARVLGDLPGVSGSTILGTGRVGLIVDVPALMQRATRVAPAVTPFH